MVVIDCVAPKYLWNSGISEVTVIAGLALMMIYTFVSVMFLVMRLTSRYPDSNEWLNGG
jgi:hypothetical protein